MMLKLTLTEEIPGGPVTELGTVLLVREQHDSAGQVSAYALESEGQRIGTVSGWLECYGPWRLAQTALNVIYGGLEVKRDKKLLGDGQCNARTFRGYRCKVSSIPGRYYCALHDPIGTRRRT